MQIYIIKLSVDKPLKACSGDHDRCSCHGIGYYRAGYPNAHFLYSVSTCLNYYIFFTFKEVPEKLSLDILRVARAKFLDYVIVLIIRSAVLCCFRKEMIRFL